MTASVRCDARRSCWRPAASARSSASTTNPSVSTGDGVAAALRAGAVVRDLEFVQFHPTVAWLGPRSRGQQPLVSEAVRGEGAFLVDDDGVRFMAGPARTRPTWPRATSWRRRSCVACTRPAPTTCGSTPDTSAPRSGGCGSRPSTPRCLARHRPGPRPDPGRPRVPLRQRRRADRPVRANRRWPGCYACGEAACTGVHGANRLASNSLLEGLVFGRRIAETLIARFGERAAVPRRRLPTPPRAGGAATPRIRGRSCSDLMSRDVGVLRDAKGLTLAAQALADLAGYDGGVPGTEAWETTNLLTVAAALAQAARLRHRDPWLALARRLPRRGRRALARAPRHRADPRR